MLTVDLVDRLHAVEGAPIFVDHLFKRFGGPKRTGFETRAAAALVRLGALVIPTVIEKADEISEAKWRRLEEIVCAKREIAVAFLPAACEALDDVAMSAAELRIDNLVKRIRRQCLQTVPAHVKKASAAPALF